MYNQSVIWNICFYANFLSRTLHTAMSVEGQRVNICEVEKCIIHGIEYIFPSEGGEADLAADSRELGRTRSQLRKQVLSAQSLVQPTC